MPFKLISVYAGTQEPVRTPLYLYTPLRNFSGNASDWNPSQSRMVETQHVNETQQQNESNYSAGLAPTGIPSDLLALLEAQPGAEPAVAVHLGGTRTIAPLVLEESTLTPPEPPPGEPDIKPPPVTGGHLVPAQIIKQPPPAYPPLARTARIEGVVLLEATINVSGTLENIRVVDGHPMLVDEAVKAVKKWKYRPAVLNGQTIPSPVTITVRFILKYAGD